MEETRVVNLPPTAAACSALGSCVPGPMAFRLLYIIFSGDGVRYVVKRSWTHDSEVVPHPEGAECPGPSMIRQLPP